MYANYIMSDQPATCPTCGARTEIIADFLHTLSRFTIHQWLSPRDEQLFLEAEDYV